MLLLTKCFCLVLFFVSIVSNAWANEDAEAVANMVIVVNRNDSDSLQLGQHYADQRGISRQRIVQLEAPMAETISLTQYVEAVANPLLNALLENGWVRGVKASTKDAYGRERLTVSVHKISYVVMMRGMPLRIANDPEKLSPLPANMPERFKVNRASVDSELALLLAPDGAGMTGMLRNPFFENPGLSGSEGNRLLRVMRLDGPSASDVHRLIDRTLEAEKTGLMGRAYIDTGGPHARGDQWIRAAGELAEAAYFDTDYESTRKMIDLTHRFDAPVIYMGWYRPRPYGPWAEGNWPVPPGAIGFHLHSFSATSLRRPNTWLGAFVSQGYAATVGNVYEPYLEFTHRPQVLLRHLLRGGRFGDAVYLSMPALSWQGVAVGDPLYRPFGREAAGETAADGEGPFAVYVIIREINRLAAEEGKAAALAYARAQFGTAPSLPLALRLARMYRAEGKETEAVAVLGIIRFMNRFPPDERILAQKCADMLHELGESERALAVYDNLLAERRLDATLRDHLLMGGRRIADAAGIFWSTGQPVQ